MNLLDLTLIMAGCLILGLVGGEAIGRKASQLHPCGITITTTTSGGKICTTKEGEQPAGTCE